MCDFGLLLHKYLHLLTYIELFSCPLEGREEQHISDRRGVGHDHHEAVDTVADAACGRHTDL